MQVTSTGTGCIGSPMLVAMGMAALVVVLATPACAETPAYVGMWSKTSVHCSTEQKRPGAPMLITEQGFDQYKLHCKFANVEPVAATPSQPASWNVKADCEWNGIATKMEMAFAVTGANESVTLTLRDSGGTHTLMKCVPPPAKPAAP